MSISGNKLGIPGHGDQAFLAQTVNPHFQTGALGVGVIADA